MTGLAVTREGAVTHWRLTRPEAGNALDLALTAALEAAVGVAATDGTRVVVLSAEGALFCGGGDVAAMSGAADPGAYTLALASRLHRALLGVAEAGLVLVAAVQGAAAGAGFGIVLNADYVVASEKATFLTAYSALGVSPDGGTTHLLPRIVGPQRSAELVFAGRRLDAATAHEWGIVNRVVGPDEVADTAASIAAGMARTPAAALSANKRLLSAGWLPGYREHLAAEAASIADLIATDESRALREAFLTRGR
ncbi:enoyl-CoA hydratase/isomerase family protein [Microbacterium sp.]|uniref:enoyl-CoA hydratase/isomerase family protein n=1 Tax=Microbacterium sp. TaxID=51671 RepID=UPI003A8765BF